MITIPGTKQGERECQRFSHLNLKVVVNGTHKRHKYLKLSSNNKMNCTKVDVFSSERLISLSRVKVPHGSLIHKEFVSCCICVFVFACMTPQNIISDITVPSAFQNKLASSKMRKLTSLKAEKLTN